MGNEANETVMGELLQVNDLFNALQKLYKDVVAGTYTPSKGDSKASGASAKTNGAGEAAKESKKDKTAKEGKNKEVEVEV